MNYNNKLINLITTGCHHQNVSNASRQAKCGRNAGDTYRPASSSQILEVVECIDNQSAHVDGELKMDHR